MRTKIMNMETPLFKGDTYHPITEEEWRKLEAKIKVQGELASHEKVMAALRMMAKCSTGRQQIREIIASNETFPVEVSKEADAEIERRGAAGFNQKQVVVHPNGYHETISAKTSVHSKYLDNPEFLGMTLLHEFLHQRQPVDLPHSSIILDMETQALNKQLSMELNSDKSECASYRQSYAQNLRYWRAVMDGKLPKPAWAPDFEVIEQGNLSNQEYATLKKVAMDRYIHKMASEEAQAQFMADFTMSRFSMNNGDFSMYVPSYAGIRTNLFYDAAGISDNLRKMAMTPSAQSYFKNRYPALDMEKVERHARELNAEYFEIDSALKQLAGKLNGALSSQLSFEERIKVSANCIRGLNCSKEAKKILSEELIELFSSDRSLSNSDKIIAQLQRNLKTTYSHEDGKREVQEKGVDEETRRIVQAESYLEAVEYVAGRRDLSTSAKLYQFAEIVRWHKERYPETDAQVAKERTQMLQIVRQSTGLEGLPSIQGEFTLQKALRSSSGRMLAIEDNARETNGSIHSSSVSVRTADEDTREAITSLMNIGGSRIA